MWGFTMRRKVIQIADSTQLISLPRKWCIANGIKKGDELNVNETGPQLVISTEIKELPRTVRFDISGLDRDSIIYAIRSAYTQGFDEIYITHNTARIEDYRKNKKVAVAEVLSHEISRLHGVEIFSQTDVETVLKSISSDSEREFSNLFNRILFLILEMLQEFSNAYQQNKLDQLRNVEAKHDLISKFVYYCERVLSKTKKDVSKARNIRSILNYLDLCVDSIKYSARAVIENPHKPPRAVIEHVDAIVCDFNQFVKLLKKFSFEDLKKMNELLTVRATQLGELIQKTPSSEAKTLSFINTFVENLRFGVFAVVSAHFAEKAESAQPNL